MMRVRIRSRRGNLILAVLGFIYAVGGVFLLIWLATDVWLAASLRDRVLQIGLLGAILCGIWFGLNSMMNLGIHVGRRDVHR